MTHLLSKAEGKQKTVVKGATAAQVRYLKYGIYQPGGKLPLFDSDGQRIKASTIRSCIKNGWCSPWYTNPMQPKWLVCKLTKEGYALLKDTLDG